MLGTHDTGRRQTRQKSPTQKTKKMSHKGPTKEREVKPGARE
jgi:hypothetical protein